MKRWRPLEALPGAYKWQQAHAPRSLARLLECLPRAETRRKPCTVAAFCGLEAGCEVPGEGGLKLEREGCLGPWLHVEVLRQRPSLAFIILNAPSEEAPQGGGCEGACSIIVQARLQARRRVAGGACRGAQARASASGFFRGRFPY